MNALTIDGQEGGGQMLRTALALAIVTERRVVIDNVRGNRDTPGLRPQHIAGIRVLSQLTSAYVSGGYVDSTEVIFHPRRTPSGDANLDVGTAGSLPLLFETVVHLGPVLEESISVTATGGTDVKWSPTMAYFEEVKLATLRQWGFDVSVDVKRTGFYPAGGGEATVTVAPADPPPLDLTERGARDETAVLSTASEDLSGREVAERQCEGAAAVLEAAGIELETVDVTYVDTESSGTSILVRGRYRECVAGFDNLGERGVPAEDIGAAPASDFIIFDRGPAVVDRHLGDQLMLPLALVGGSVRVPEVTGHMRTNASVINAFGGDIEFTTESEGHATISAGETLV